MRRKGALVGAVTGAWEEVSVSSPTLSFEYPATVQTGDVALSIQLGSANGNISAGHSAQNGWTEELDVREVIYVSTTYHNLQYTALHETVTSGDSGTETITNDNNGSYSYSGLNVYFKYNGSYTGSTFTDLGTVSTNSGGTQNVNLASLGSNPILLVAMACAINEDSGGTSGPDITITFDGEAGDVEHSVTRSNTGVIIGGGVIAAKYIASGAGETSYPVTFSVAGSDVAEGDMVVLAWHLET